eukprot:gene12016-biopygen2061
MLFTTLESILWEWQRRRGKGEEDGSKVMLRTAANSFCTSHDVIHVNLGLTHAPAHVDTKGKQSKEGGGATADRCPLPHSATNGGESAIFLEVHGK